LKSSHPKVLKAFVLTDLIHGRLSQDKCTWKIKLLYLIRHMIQFISQIN
jgi:hypothetical protein